MVLEGGDLDGICGVDGVNVVGILKVAGLGAGLALHFPGHDLH